MEENGLSMFKQLVIAFALACVFLGLVNLYLDNMGDHRRHSFPWQFRAYEIYDLADLTQLEPIAPL